ncbi:MAG: S24 family peptidase [Anaerotignum sp.]|nr:S24 family peptidase [Anaerotignum sp.]
MDTRERILSLMENNHITKYRLAKEIEVSSGIISDWANGKSSSYVKYLDKIARYFGVTVDYLLGKTAFKNGFELFEHWGYSAIGFEAAFDFGELLKAAREAQDNSPEEVSQALGITISDVENIEEGILPLNYEWAEKYAEFLGTSVSQIFFDNNMYDEQVPAEFHDNVKKYEILKKEAEDEAKLSAAYTTSKETETPSIESDPNYMGEYEPKKLKKIPVYGVIAAGLPIYAEEQIEGYVHTDLNGGAEYFGLRVKGDSMNAARIWDGDIIIVRKQPCVENGEIAVVLVDGENATVKKFYKEGNRITLVPASTNPEHTTQFYNLRDTEIKVLGRVVKNEIAF